MVYVALSAWTAIIDTEWDTMSCSSRAIAARSASAACCRSMAINLACARPRSMRVSSRERTASPIITAPKTTTVSRNDSANRLSDPFSHSAGTGRSIRDQVLMWTRLTHSAPSAPPATVRAGCSTRLRPSE
ncbi:hypothetical protein SUDANB151_02116 [Streptomyces sp. enrichment culture]